MAIFTEVTENERIIDRHLRDIHPLLDYDASESRCEIGCKLVLITNRKSHMGFRLVPKSVTLNDVERRNGRYLAFFRRIR